MNNYNKFDCDQINHNFIWSTIQMPLANYIDGVKKDFY